MNKNEKKIQRAVRIAFLPRKEADSLTLEFCCDESFNQLCARNPTLRYDRLRGEKRERMIRLRELYIAETGKIPFK
jgi:hypothetical protein